MIHVCSLARLHETVEDSGARHVVSLIGDEDHVERPPAVEAENHLWLRLHDISAPLDGYIMPEEKHVTDLLRFVRRWDRRAPLVVHCYAGISRSTASAFASVCALNPHRNEESIALALRRASPTATPNIRIVSLADRLLGRDGRMVAAIETIGRGIMATEATPFRLELE
ncbi:MAG TPA: protein-tyrosine phosphatase family protein [Xanthobacteraceae bacterium]|nr:protein-tyrosine phosphatase family protein [Xanthobacteraceae bacterium]